MGKIQHFLRSPFDFHQPDLLSLHSVVPICPRNIEALGETATDRRRFHLPRPLDFLSIDLGSIKLGLAGVLVVKWS